MNFSWNLYQAENYPRRAITMLLMRPREFKLSEPKTETRGVVLLTDSIKDLPTILYIVVD